jgi:hypothetical protein
MPLADCEGRRVVPKFCCVWSGRKSFNLPLVACSTLNLDGRRPLQASFLGPAAGFALAVGSLFRRLHPIGELDQLWLSQQCIVCLLSVGIVSSNS